MIVAVAFVTMAVGVNARTAFSLFFPPILGEFGWERGVTAGAFSFGFVIAAVLGPLLGRLMDRHGPRVAIELGVVVTGAGLLLGALVSQPWHLYLSLGCWSVRAPCAWATAASRCTCRTGSCDAGDSR